HPFFVLFSAAAALSGCASQSALAPVAVVAGPPARPAIGTIVPERYVSPSLAGEELDSLATWPTPDGGLWLVATAKSSHRLVVFDAVTGERLHTVGGRGTGPGEFLRPNGIAAWGDHLFVVERDGRRVQVLRLPGFEPVGDFGADALRSPYGVWVREAAPGELEAYVTDNYMLGQDFDVVPPANDLDERIRRYRVSFDPHGGLVARELDAFGDTDRGALHRVESLAGDPVTQVLLVADEFPPAASTLRVYALDGTYAGRDVATAFDAEAEGVALWDCGIGDDGAPVGYWIAADQLQPATRFHVFERATLAPVGTFTGETVAWTDGIALHAAAAPGFPHGALFAVHDDRSVAAFDLGGIARALGLGGACLR
ncbi:MAG TPA: phytase, partial [Xanthomonadaceae bacterium]|nr:phytase [Xanthomonadaceae bacterium]